MNESSTHVKYEKVIAECRELFIKKTKDYGTSWRILRLTSITDLMIAKAKRIRSIEEKGVQKVKDPIEGEFISLVNYGIIATIQYHESDNLDIKLSIDEAAMNYNIRVSEIIELLEHKNHDYGEAWRDMRISSMVDLMLMKLIRIKQIENNNGQALVSEGVKSGYQDIVNYAIFCLILMNEKKLKKIEENLKNQDK